MTSLNYNEVFSIFYSRVEAYDFLSLKNDEVNEFLCSWIRSVISKPYIRRLFTSISIDDEIQVLSYELKYSVDEDSDRYFVTEILGLGIAIQWLEPKINSTMNIAQMFGSKEEKFFSQSQHLKELRDLKESLHHEQRSMIRDRGYAWNSYLDGE